MKNIPILNSAPHGIPSIIIPKIIATTAAAKSALEGLVKTLAFQFAKYNVTVNCVSPGFIVTDMTNKIPEKIRSILISKIPMGKLGSVDDVSNCAAFLSSDEASYITGETIHVNGGMYMA